MMRLGVVDGKDQDLDARALGDDFAEGHETVEDGHIQIENHKIRT